MATYTSSAKSFSGAYGSYRAVLDLSSSSSSTTTTITYTARVQMKSAYMYGVYISCGGKTASGYLSSNPGSSWTTVATVTGTTSVARSTSAQTKSFTATAGGKTVNGIGAAGSSSVSVSGSVSVPALASYSVTYNANGGSGAPGAQTKWYGKTLTLSSTKPTRANYTFVKWNTTSGGTGTNYSPGGSYTTNNNAILYAQWKLITYQILFNDNGGSNGPGSQTKNSGTNLVISSTEPTRDNYYFIGWNTSLDGTGDWYYRGDSYSKESAATLYAQWQVAYRVPEITNVQALRVDSGGNPDDSGTYAKIAFSWTIDAAHGAEIDSIKIYYKLRRDTQGTLFKTITPTTTSGDVSVVDTISGGFSIDHVYDFKIEVVDSKGSSYETTYISQAFFTIDILSGGRGVAIGAPSEQEGLYLAMDIMGKDSTGNTIDLFKNGAISDYAADSLIDATVQSLFESEINGGSNE